MNFDLRPGFVFSPLFFSKEEKRLAEVCPLAPLLEIVMPESFFQERSP